MAISGLHVNACTSAAVRISRHGFGRSSGLVCTDTVLKSQNVYQPNPSKFTTFMENTKTLKMERKIREEFMKVLDHDFARQALVFGKFTLFEQVGIII